MPRMRPARVITSCCTSCFDSPASLHRRGSEKGVGGQGGKGGGGCECRACVQPLGHVTLAAPPASAALRAYTEGAAEGVGGRGREGGRCRACVQPACDHFLLHLLL